MLNRLLLPIQNSLDILLTRDKASLRLENGVFNFHLYTCEYGLLFDDETLVSVLRQKMKIIRLLLIN